jgi:hypothetical protein
MVLACVLVLGSVAGLASLRASRADNRRSALTQTQAAYARTHLGGAGLAATAKGGDPDAATSRATPGNGAEGDRLAAAAAEQAAQRAFPASEVSADQIAGAVQAFNAIKIRGNSGSKKGAFLWNSIGPSQAVQPGLLNFTGQDYVTSGRTTAMLIDRTCNQGRCRLWIGAAGGGVWRTDHALHTNNPGWKFSSGGLGSNAFGTLVQDPNDPSGDTLYAGTGEPNASGDSESGTGVYKSTDGGESWSLLGTSDTIAKARSVSGIAVDPTDANVIYVSTARGVRGVSSVSGGAASVTGAAMPALGVYKTTNGGATWTLVWDAGAAGSLRGAIDLELDPLNHTTVYASAFQLGLWRSVAGGAFAQVFAAQAPPAPFAVLNTDRTMFDLTVKDGKVRIYLTDGAQGTATLADGPPPVLYPYSALFRTDDASQLAQGSPNTALWKKLTSNVNGNPYYPTFDFCTGQCWYDQDVMTPNGSPDTVFVIGSYTYGELGGRSNARAVLRSTTAGEPDAAHGDRTFTDMTMDAAFNSIHPDQHELVFQPGNPDVWWSGSDGGVVRSSGQYTDITAQCADRPLGAASIITCGRLLSAVPTRIYSLNEGLTTMQFQSVSLNPHNPTGELMGGTQDNGTWLYNGNSNTWTQTIYGDGGQSGFDVANPDIRFNQFFGGFGDVNFRAGDPEKWVIATAPILRSGEAVAFYWPEIADPRVGGSIYTGFQSVWRTKDNGGDRDFLEANCPEFTTPGDKAGCGDFVALGGTGGPNSASDLTSAAWGDRARNAGAGVAGLLAQVERTTADTGTLWAATATGRVFITKNSDAEPATATTWTRLDSLATNDPPRFVSSIYVDPANANRAWISYSGYNTTISPPTIDANKPGHVFRVDYNPTAGTATWTDLSHDLADLPITDVVRDDPTGDLYAASDFGVLRLAAGSSSWTVAGSGLPIVETSGLTISTSSRRLYAATHGMSIWYMNLP